MGNAKSRFREFFSEQKNELKELFFNYRVTLIVGIIIAVFYELMSFTQMGYDSDFFAHSVVILWFMLAGSFFSETYFSLNDNKEKYIVAIGISAAMAVIIDVTNYMLNENYSEKIYTYFIKIISMYVIVLLLMSIYKLIKKSNLDIGKYAARAIFGLLKIWGVFIVLILASIFLLEIFDALIADIDYWDAMERIQILLAGLVYFPFSLMAITDTNDDNSRFTKGFFMYALMPCVIIAIGIIYLYIIKIFGDRLPSNEVFPICAWVFILGAPIWVIAGEFLREKAEKKGEALGLYGKLVVNMKYIYAPFIILEIICLGMRIGAHGLTEVRVLGIFFIVFQLIYICWRPINKLLKKDMGYEALIPVAVVMAFVGLLAPFINMEYLSYLSQKSIFEKGMEDEDYFKAAGAYEYLRYSVYGEEYIKENYTEEERNELQETFYWSYKENDQKVYDYTEYISTYSDSVRLEGLNTEGYSTVFEINVSYHYELTYDDVEAMTLKYGDEKETPKFNLMPYIEYCAGLWEQEKNTHSNIEPECYNIDINNSMRLVIHSSNFRHNPYEEYFEYLTINAYLLIK